MATEAEPVTLFESLGLFAPLEKSKGVLLAVSGGPDSLALLVLFQAWQREYAPHLPYCVATVNHGLRPESGEEALKVRDLCKPFSPRHDILVWEGFKPSRGLQNAARKARYQLLMQHAQSHELTHIITAHTADDQVETILMRLGRSTGISGLAGIPKIRPLTPSLFVFRPFLEISKTRLQATVFAKGLQPVEDPSNMDTRFMRAKIRALHPHLESLSLTRPAFLALARRAARTHDALEYSAEQAFYRCLTQTHGRRLIFENTLFQEPEEVVLRVIGRVFRNPLFTHVSTPRLEQLESLCTNLYKAYASKKDMKINMGRIVFWLKPSGRLAVEPEKPRRVKKGNQL
jgi:tRNA(Ile)-lysidine synthase